MIRRSGVVLLFVVSHALFGQERPALEQSILSAASSFGGRVGVAAKNISTGETILVHGDSLFPSASIIKLPIIVELFYKFRSGECIPSQPVALLDSVKKPGSGVLQFLHGGQQLPLIDVATLMIILSDNTATNYIIDQLGADHEARLAAVNDRMKLLGLQHTKLLNKPYSWATKKKTEEARRFGIGVSCPKEMMILLEKLVEGSVVDSASSVSIIGIMKNQQDVLQAPRYLPFQEDTTLWIANKTGSLDEVKNDVGIVSCSRGTYVYSIFCDNSQDLGEQVDNRATIAVAKVSRLLFDHFLVK